jgi:hypothetical protein
MTLAKKTMLQAKPTNFSRTGPMERTDEQMAAMRHEPATLMLDVHGMIHDCSLSGGSLFGYHRNNLVQQHVSSLFPQLADVVLVENGRINPRLCFLCHCGHLFMTQGREGNKFSSNLSFVLLDAAGKKVLRMIVCPADDSGSQ